MLSLTDQLVDLVARAYVLKRTAASKERYTV